MSSNLTLVLSRIPRLVAFAPMWAGAVGWHLWRILTLRPAFARLSETPLTIGSFYFVFVASIMLRWSVLGGMSAMSALIGAILTTVLILLLFERKGRSSVLPAAVFAASAAIDLLGSVLHVTGIYLVDIAPGGNLLSYPEYLLWAYTAWQFSREPSEVKKSGYRSK